MSRILRVDFVVMDFVEEGRRWGGDREELRLTSSSGREKSSLLCGMPRQSSKLTRGEDVVV